ncbi:uncharacterized protein LOC124805854 [Hydra vulgaris]|uniref:uncharacterized protein LOC124805854 n=1 Tax=Hydra vulgaris TaxID=6087 RepID=UPI001F5FE87C|nr:uncharacterized protein LOC124805854 [Hydra vulgaris]
MPGANCAFPECGITRNSKHQSIGIFQLPNRPDDFHQQWRKNILNILSKCRHFDKHLKERIANGNIFLCELHFEPTDIEFTKTGRKTLKLGAIPLLNIPKKSHETVKAPERRHISIVKDILTTEEKHTDKYKNFSELTNIVKKLKLNWFISYDKNFISFKSFQTFTLVPHLEVVVGCSLEFFVIVYGWTLPDDHHLYKEFLRSVRHVKISKLLNKVQSLQMCTGITYDLVDCDKDGNLINHSIPHKFDLNNEKKVPFKASQYKRHKDCFVIGSDCEKCVKCLNFEINFIKCKVSTSKKIDQPAHLNAPLSVTHPNRVKLALVEERSKNKKLVQNIERMQKEIQAKGIQVSTCLSSDLDIIISKNQKNMTPFMKLFWEEQNRLLTSKVPRYHPMIIRFCLSLASKSASAYDELRDAKILTLPSRRTLRDYKNAIRPSVGFNPAVIAELKENTKDLSDIQRNVVLSFDEIRIQDNLVFDKSSGELVGYVDLGDPEINFSTFTDVNDLASHCLVYYIRGIACDLKFCLAYFATNGVTAMQIMPTFWKAVSILELCCNLKVIVAVSDGASPNRSFYKMHRGLDIRSR